MLRPRTRRSARLSRRILGSYVPRARSISQNCRGDTILSAPTAPSFNSAATRDEHLGLACEGFAQHLCVIGIGFDACRLGLVNQQDGFAGDELGNLRDVSSRQP